MAAKRRRFFVFLKNEPPQRYYVGMHFFMLLGLMIALTVSAHQLFQHYVLSVDSIELSKPAFTYHLKDLFREFMVRVAIVFVIGFLMTVMIGLSFLHRVTGPMVRVCKIIDEFAEGKFSEEIIHFRRNDFSKDVSASLNRLLNFLNRTQISGKKPKE